MSFDDFRKENKEFFDVEEAAIPYFNKYYESNGYTVLKRLKGDENKKRDVDLLHIKTNIEYKVEEKSASYYYPANPLELFQNIPHPEIPTVSLGNLYTTKAYFVAHIYFMNEEPYRLYLWRPTEIKKNIKVIMQDTNKHKYGGLDFAFKGWGITIIYKAPWEYLISRKYAILEYDYKNVTKELFNPYELA